MPVTSVRTRALAVLACASLLACRGARDPILDLLKELQQAAEARDASRIEATLADDFQGSGRTSRQEAGAELKRYFALYETVKLEIYEVSVERNDATARLRFRVDFSRSCAVAPCLRAISGVS